MRRLIRVSFWLLALGVAAIVLLTAASVHTFNTLTDETLVAEVRFERAGQDQYLAYLRTGDFCAERVLPIYGDQWRIDAEFIKWHYWASLLGLDSQYRLDRLEGRYRDVESQNRRTTLAHTLRPETTLDVVDLSDSLGRLNFLADASYGSSTYQDIDTSLEYRVYKSPTGLLARSGPRAPGAAADDSLSVEIRRGCGEAEGLWSQLAGWLNGGGPA